MLLKTVITRILFVLLLGLIPLQAVAVEPTEMLDDPVLEARARTLSAGLRCLVCQNQSIDDSNADLARDLRVLVRERLVNGDSNQQVLDYVVSRYGQFVLLKPVFNMKTFLLWGAPIIVLLLAFGLFMVWLKTSKTRSAIALSQDETDRLNKILDGSDR